MATPIRLHPGSPTAVGASLPIARIVWHEPPASGGTAVVRDGNGNVLATISYAGRGKGPEPAPQTFNPPIAASGTVHLSAPGGFAQIWIQGASSFGN